MWYRRITEFMDVDPPPSVRVHTTRPAEKVKFGHNAFSGFTFGPKPASKFPPVSTKRKLDCIELEEDDIAHFKRVRLITSKERVKFIPGPFREVKIAGKDLSFAAAERHRAAESDAWEAFRTNQSTLGSSHPNTILSLGNLTRTLRNIGKSSGAEDILQKTLGDEESTLVEKDPASLRVLLGSLMVALVDQKKFDAAEELWTRASDLFVSRASAEEQAALIRDLELAHPFRQSVLAVADQQPNQRKAWTIDDLPSSFPELRSPYTLPKTIPKPEPEPVSKPTLWPTPKISWQMPMTPETYSRWHMDVARGRFLRTPVSARLPSPAKSHSDDHFAAENGFPWSDFVRTFVVEPSSAACADSSATQNLFNTRHYCGRASSFLAFLALTSTCG
ncbi:uncharacterized protein LY89DRAFT_274853 [Mollisia scopiformis]|uniref:Uncharacterized protein n=1 Tax=Mollisia scopiformis TaxID=149040 RepID=A0A132BDA2_MOLSC|nr:uncharacterized protein LY89DRAFT_274853 [Mollisia scopiformis]KUJ09637.1 hypothetical protein LY89DRAFT_274853 [Mollisia scopiformis]